MEIIPRFQSFSFIDFVKIVLISEISQAIIFILRCNITLTIV